MKWTYAFTYLASFSGDVYHLRELPSSVDLDLTVSSGALFFPSPEVDTRICKSGQAGKSGGAGEEGRE